MSYVIQNFYKPNTLIISGHRFKLILKTLQIFKFFTFFKFFIVNNRIPKILIFTPSYFRPFFLLSFYKLTHFFEKTFSINTRLHLTTKFHRTVWINALSTLEKLLSKKHVNPFLLSTGSSLVTCAYYFPTKVIFIPLAKTNYKPLFLIFLFFTPLQWPTLESFYQYSNVFLYPSFLFKLLYFENRKIFRTQHL